MAKRKGSTEEEIVNKKTTKKSTTVKKISQPKDEEISKTNIDNSESNIDEESVLSVDDFVDNGNEFVKETNDYEIGDTTFRKEADGTTNVIPVKITNEKKEYNIPCKTKNEPYVKEKAKTLETVVLSGDSEQAITIKNNIEKTNKCALIASGLSIRFKQYQYPRLIQYANRLDNMSNEIAVSMNKEIEEVRLLYDKDEVFIQKAISKIDSKYNNRLIHDQLTLALEFVYELIEEIDGYEDIPSFDTFLTMIKTDDLQTIFMAMYMLQNDKTFINISCPNEDCKELDDDGKSFNRKQLIFTVPIEQMFKINNSDITEKDVTKIFNDRTFFNGWKKTNKVYKTYQEKFEIKFDNTPLIKSIIIRKPSLADTLRLMKTVIFHSNAYDYSKTEQVAQQSIYEVDLAYLLVHGDYENSYEDVASINFLLWSLISEISFIGIVEEAGEEVDKIFKYVLSEHDDDVNIKMTQDIISIVSQMNMTETEILYNSSIYSRLAHYRPFVFYLPKKTCPECNTSTTATRVDFYNVFFLGLRQTYTRRLRSLQQKVITSTLL